MVQMGARNDEKLVFRLGNEHLGWGEREAQRCPDCPRTGQSRRGAKGRPGKRFDPGAALPALQDSALATFPAEPVKAQ